MSGRNRRTEMGKMSVKEGGGRLSNRIRRSMLALMTGILLLFYICFSLILYVGNMRILKSEVQREAAYIERAVSLSGDGRIRRLDQVNGQTRVTRITRDGTVTYDSGGNESSLQNHMDRPEVVKALKTGAGEDTRISETTGKKMYYYAVLLPDDSLLRVSRQTDTLAKTALGILPVVSVLLLIMIGLSYLFSGWQTRRLLSPLYEIDLQKPTDHPVYEEMRPFLEELERHNRRKDEAAQMRKEFSANVSHELKTPLTSISGYAELIENGLVSPGDIAGFGKKIHRESMRLLRLIEDIMRLSRLDEGQIEQEKTLVDLYEVAVEAVERMSQSAREREVAVSLSGERITVTGVQQMISEMIFNLVENAVKYNRSGGSVSIWIGKVHTGSAVVVEDTGIGINASDKERIFERFYRADKSHSRQIGGTGLGLSIVKHAALLHGAEIMVESSPGVGTKMTVVFPEDKNLA